jgi:cell division protein FtsI/penicillin-binding protein 2
MSRFLNTSFGQGIQVTQIQQAVAYAAVINGGKIIKPTIVSGITRKSQNSDLTEHIQQLPRVLSQLFRSSVSDNMRRSLNQNMRRNSDYVPSMVE